MLLGLTLPIAASLLEECGDTQTGKHKNAESSVLPLAASALHCTARLFSPLGTE